MLVVNSSCQINATEAFCLDFNGSCFYTAKSTSAECEPIGQAVYIKCGTYCMYCTNCSYLVYLKISCYFKLYLNQAQLLIS